MDARDMPSAAWNPNISRVRDAGGARVPRHGGWTGESDEIAVPGEIVMLEGSDFGRLPTVTIGGRAATVIARTDGGGIVTRVPPGVPAGDIEVAISHPKGRGTGTLHVRRLAVALHEGRVHFLEVKRDGAKPHGPALKVPGALRARLSSDGSAAYVLATGQTHDRLVAIDLAAAGQPRISAEVPLSHRATLLASAESTPILVVAGEGRATYFITPHPRRPQPFDPVAMPKEMQSARAIELSPDGKLLAGLIPDGNRLVALEVVTEPRPAMRLLTQVDLLPGEKLPLVRDLAFASDGETLWVISGNNERTLPAVEPTRLTAVRLIAGDPSEPAAAATPAIGGAPVAPAAAPASGARLVSVWRTQSVPGAAAPLRIAVARGQPLASGTTIRMPPDKAAVFATAVNDALFKLGELKPETPAGAAAAHNLWKPATPGMIVRADINGGGGPMMQVPQLMSAIDLTPDAQLLLATSARLAASPPTGGAALEFGVTVTPIWGAPSPTFIPLGPISGANFKPPFQIGDLRIQP
jgi:hypothetical protein